MFALLSEKAGCLGIQRWICVSSLRRGLDEPQVTEETLFFCSLASLVALAHFPRLVAVAVAGALCSPSLPSPITCDHSPLDLKSIHAEIGLGLFLEVLLFGLCRVTRLTPPTAMPIRSTVQVPRLLQNRTTENTQLASDRSMLSMHHKFIQSSDTSIPCHSHQRVSSAPSPYAQVRETAQAIDQFPHYISTISGFRHS